MRIAVEVDLLQPLKGKVEMQDETYNVEYEGLPTVCYNCRCVDHYIAACPLLRGLKNPA
ncbi:hypothetical protein Tsubulata_035371 [Turnera subulata]|uniref:Zinc knuckle CX2CX4HX4C domain-containing protein n=1 Tax=Turnera subulata TaxID=218843 RepID=A0A9Q0JIQ1_9ROSI|nr:hypothetical protein Tsubulata_035371 [Turnera subulata]